jgi:hypothetical protein
MPHLANKRPAIIPLVASRIVDIMLERADPKGLTFMFAVSSSRHKNA